MGCTSSKRSSRRVSDDSKARVSQSPKLQKFFGEDFPDTTNKVCLKLELHPSKIKGSCTGCKPGADARRGSSAGQS